MSDRIKCRNTRPLCSLAVKTPIFTCRAAPLTLYSHTPIKSFDREDPGEQYSKLEPNPSSQWECSVWISGSAFQLFILEHSMTLQLLIEKNSIKKHLGLLLWPKDLEKRTISLHLIRLLQTLPFSATWLFRNPNVGSYRFGALEASVTAWFPTSLTHFSRGWDF